MQKQVSEELVRNIVEEVLQNLRKGPAASTSASCGCRKGGSGNLGVFPDAASAAAAARVAFEQLRSKGIEGRVKVVELVKRICTAKDQEWGKLEFDETKIGRLDHKIEKLQGIKNLPGIEWLRPYGMSGDHGISMEENTPFGVVGAITPVTHSIPTLACNVINIVAAGNTVVFNAHPGGAKCAAAAVRTFNAEIERELGISNIITIIETPTLDSFNELCASPDVNLLVITGGPGVVKAAMASGKRAICAGPGNPPVVVDESARLDKAARHILFGASYDNNLLCIGEKQIFVLDKVYSQFLESFKRAGAVQLNDRELKALTAEAFNTTDGAGGCSKAVLNRALVGASPDTLAKIAGRSIPQGTELLFAETDKDHLFVEEEQMMPMVPVIRVRDIHEAVELAKESEHGYKHSSMIHTLNVEHMTYMAKALDSTLFVKNGACTAGLGNGGEGYSSFSIATTTGEGITTPLTFTRKRRCVMVDNLNLF
ncbi:MAG: aldehyde dehydrogenase [Kiritimatiellae bacterium]|jgi:aldehyde dehydrogenase|nr:aldehyde dehydrogenase [Kiritimatiellia bacterium]